MALKQVPLGPVLFDDELSYRWPFFASHVDGDLPVLVVPAFATFAAGDGFGSASQLQDLVAAEADADLKKNVPPVHVHLLSRFVPT
jgi:metallophosphoesterase superfamily enzyme